MKILLYNIAYGTGGAHSFYGQIANIHNYIRTSHRHLTHITEFIEQEKVDIVGLVEVDTGSYRTGYKNQVDIISNHLNMFHHYSIKYGKRSINRKFPILNKQANAVLSKEKAQTAEYLYFPAGAKRLIIKLNFKEFNFYLIHLSLQRRTRKKQIQFLIENIKNTKPVIIAGDLNTFTGEEEISDLKQQLNLINPNSEQKPTHPSWKPKRQLDYILCSNSLTIEACEIPSIKHSDHLPLIVTIKDPT